MILFLLSGENVELAKWEVLQLARSYGELRNFFTDNRLLLIDYEGEDFFWRLAMSHEVAEVIATCSFEELESVFEEIEIPDVACCVRVFSFEKIDKMALERKLGEVLWRRGARISVSKPEVVFKIYIADRCYVTKLVHVVDKKQFLLRSPNSRPFFMPSVVLPKFARALVNLSGARRNLLDPMCGTGSIIIEALLMGIDAVGMDLYEKIARGCMRNLEFYGLKGDVLVGDARRMPFRDGSFEAVVTDYPYLRSTKTKGSLEDLYRRTAEEFERVLRGYAVVVSNIDAEEFFDMQLVAKFYQRVHGSLTRRILLLKPYRSRER
ncbi:MAG: methyltransferase domain-containing protein [Archaeoglobaceae archaeon]